ncbi:hypothetical protein ACTFJI_07935 [Staphylococcus equorum]
MQNEKDFCFILMSFLVLAACSNENESNSDEKKSKASENKSEKKKNDDDKNKESDESNSKVSNKEQNNTSNDTQSSNESSVENEELNQDVTQNNNQQNRALTKDEITQKMKNGVNVNGMVDADGDTWYQAPGNGDVVGYNKADGTQCTVGGCVTPEQQMETNSEDPETANTGDVNTEINSAETEDEYINALRKKYNGGLSSGEIQTKHAIEEGYYDGDDAEEVYNEIEQREAEVDSGKYDHYKE